MYRFCTTTVVSLNMRFDSVSVMQHHVAIWKFMSRWCVLTYGRSISGALQNSMLNMTCLEKLFFISPMPHAALSWTRWATDIPLYLSTSHWCAAVSCGYSENWMNHQIWCQIQVLTDLTMAHMLSQSPTRFDVLAKQPESWIWTANQIFFSCSILLPPSTAKSFAAKPTDLLLAHSDHPDNMDIYICPTL